MNIFSIGPFEQFNVPVNPDDPYVPIDPPEEGNPFAWVYDHTQKNAQGEPVKIGPWNDRLIDIVKWLPGALQGSNLTDFVSKYQKIFNEGLHTVSCKWNNERLEASVLKKIERILEFRNPSEIDEDFIYQFVNLLGFDSANIEALVNGSLDPDDKFNKSRELIRSIPYIIANKATYQDLKQLAAIFGYGASIDVKKTNSSEEYDEGSWSEEGNPTPHFGLFVNRRLTDEEKRSVYNLIDSFRPINTVFEGISRGNSWIDPRDEQEYLTIKIIEPVTKAKMYWLKENFNFGSEETSASEEIEYGKKWVAEGGHGGLYDWRTALQICPNGWHLPHSYEIAYIEIASGGGQMTGEAGKELKAKPNDWDGTDTIKYKLLPGGRRTTEGEFEGQGSEAYLWTQAPIQISLPDSLNNAYFFDWGAMNYKAATGEDSFLPTTLNETSVNYGYSVRYVKNNESETEGIFIDDRDGKPYRWKKFGGLYWMIDNLEWGTVVDDSQVLHVGEAWKLPEADPFLSTQYQGQYTIARTGYSYSRRVAEESCPVGWRLPTREDWENLRDFMIGKYGGEIQEFTVEDPVWYPDTQTYWRVPGLAVNMKTEKCYTSQNNGNYHGYEWYGLPTKGNSSANYMCFDTMPYDHGGGAPFIWYTTLNDSSEAGFELSFDLRCAFNFGPPRGLDSNGNIAIRCCRNTRPDAHTETDWHNWYGQD